MISAEPGRQVTVIMGAYNCAATIDDAIASIVAQTYPHWDLVVCDDASTDGTAEKLAHWSERLGDRMQLLTNETNRKLAHSLNRCLEVARGDYVARMDGDDISMPQRFERQIATLGEDPTVQLVGTAMRRFDDVGPAGVVAVPEFPTRTSMKRGVPFCHATIMARRDVYDRLGGYADRPATERVEDLDLWFRFFAAGFSGRNIAEPLYLVRENLAAVRRRTLRNRINVFWTTIRGYRRLGYPFTWYAFPVLSLAKALVPTRAVMLYRSLQKNRAQRAGVA
jgi:glycosyltransferase EpsE